MGVDRGDEVQKTSHHNELGAVIRRSDLHCAVAEIEHAAEDALRLLLAVLVLLVMLRTDRIRVLAVHVLMLGLLRFRLILGFLYFALRDNLLAAVHTGRLIEAVRKAEFTAFLIQYDIRTLQSMVASAVLAMGTGVAHSY